MPVTQNLRQSSISKNSIAGYDHRGAIDGVYAGIAEVSDRVNKINTTPWKKIYDIIPRFIRNVRSWVMAEQITAFVGESNLDADPDIASLAYNTEKWINFIRAYTPLGGGVKYALYSEHFKNSVNDNGVTFSIFYAPQAGDYLVSMYFTAHCTDTTYEDFIEIICATRDNNQDAWHQPIVISGNTNVKTDDTDSTFMINGSYLVRLQRGGQIRFGILNKSRPTSWIPLTDVESRVFVTKVKFYPTLKE